ncbi:cytochrome ubiquinol oxidase subunit I [Amycolatopsis magusensis]|uniref:Cytochrome d ubiquinol oxidase subunit I n=1 Tax=Amycolatopsis magusensis TaxID=882444 RepID=A0ABS4PN12_9PSEU|nr:cytochrome ubiquinol oxidase subunit I [Amycolatopsis magusensis]MBP2180787.1 cytochrome d ubiquinol oxidase subunit I [Amycolatopsis magusensis]
MEALPIARLQFATTTSFHFLFVLLTLGLVTLVAIMQTRHALTGRAVFARMTRFWGRLYVVNYALGIATGIVMEFQFGLNWSGLSTYAGDIFGAPLAIETLVAFFLESTFLGLWIFGWDRLGKWLHLALIWLVALTAYASAFWIMAANSFLQNPVGSVEEHGVLRLTDFGALLTNPTFVSAVPHVLSAALLTGGVFVVGISAYHFLRRSEEVEFFSRSMRLGVVTTLVAAPVVFGFGTAQFPAISDLQPDKLEGGAVGLPLGLMVMIGQFFVFASLIALPFLAKNRIARARPLLRLMVWGIPLPFIAAICGWLVRELGRQPWLVFGKLTTADALSDLSAGQVLASFLAFTALFAALAVADWVLLSRLARRGPEPVVQSAPVLIGV